MSTARIFLAIFVGSLVTVVIPDYIGLGIGFYSFIGHDDLNSIESSQYMWLSIHCALMVVALGGLAAIVFLGFSKWAPKTVWLGSVLTSVAMCLAVMHIATIYLDRGWIGGEARRLFVEPGESRAWMVLAASIAAMTMFLLQRIGAIDRPSTAKGSATR